MRLQAVWAFGLLAVGCTQSGAVSTRAANDFDCPKDQVEVEDIGGNAYKAEGCGQTGTYACVGGGVNITCVREN